MSAATPARASCLRGGESSPPLRMLKLLLRLAMGAVFLYAAYDKLLRPDQLAEVITDYHLVPAPLVNEAALWLPWVELVVGLLVIAGVWVRTGALLMTAMMALFLGALALTLARGLEFECGCFTTTATGEARTWLSLWQEASLLVACLGLWLLHWDWRRRAR